MLILRTCSIYNQSKLYVPLLLRASRRSLSGFRCRYTITLVTHLLNRVTLRKMQSSAIDDVSIALSFAPDTVVQEPEESVGKDSSAHLDL